MSISRLLFLGFGLLITVLVVLSLVTSTQLAAINAAVGATGEGLSRIVEQREPLRRTGFEMEISGNELAIVPLEYLRDRTVNATERITALIEAFKKNYDDFQTLAGDEEKPTGAKVKDSFDNLKQLADESISYADEQYKQVMAMYEKAAAIEDALAQLQGGTGADQVKPENGERLRAALEMEISLHELRSAVRAYLFDRNPANRSEVADATKTFNEFRNAYVDADPSPQNLEILDEVADGFKGLNEFAVKIVDLADTRNDHFDKLQGAIGTINTTLDEDLQPKIQEKVETARDDAQTALDQALSAVGTAGWVLLGATLIGIAVGGARLPSSPGR